MGKRIDLTGKRFGRWQVLSYGRPGYGEGKGRSALWNCKCDCGTEKLVSANSLRMGTSTSCGCLNRQLIDTAHRTHGESNRTRTTEYQIWHGMLSRCRCESHESYLDYGGRGITVCSRWANSYESFLSDMGRRPSRHHSIDRKNNDDGYWCGKPECSECSQLNRKPNCQWATRAEQARNHRRNRQLTIRGKTQTHTDWAKELCVSAPTITRWVNEGRSEEEILAGSRNPLHTIDLSQFSWPQA